MMKVHLPLHHNFLLDVAVPPLGCQKSLKAGENRILVSVALVFAMQSSTAQLNPEEAETNVV